MKILNIYIDDQSVHEYDRSQALEDQQLAFLDKMDSDMEKGIKLQGELIANPDKQQRANFVALNLLKAISQDNHASISVSCAWLANRFPNLIEVHINKTDGTIEVELVEEKLDS